MPFTASEAEKALESESRRLARLLGLSHWDIAVALGRCDPDAMAEIQINEELSYASITIDHFKHSSVKEMLGSLRHEFLHILISPMYMYVEVLAEANPEGVRLMPELWERLEESVILQLEKTDIGRSNP